MNSNDYNKLRELNRQLIVDLTTSRALRSTPDPDDSNKYRAIPDPDDAEKYRVQRSKSTDPIWSMFM